MKRRNTAKPSKLPKGLMGATRARARKRRCLSWSIKVGRSRSPAPQLKQYREDCQNRTDRDCQLDFQLSILHTQLDHGFLQVLAGRPANFMRVGIFIVPCLALARRLPRMARGGVRLTVSACPRARVLAGLSWQITFSHLRRRRSLRLPAPV